MDKKEVTETKEKDKNAIKEEKIKQKEEKRKLKEERKGKKVPKEISQEMLKRVFKCLMAAIAIMAYFAILNFAYAQIKTERLLGDIKVFAGAFLVAGLVMMEIAYKKDKGKYAITAIELLVLSLHTLSITHVISKFKYDFQLYLLVSSYIIAIYFVFKAIIMYTKGRKQYLDSLSDIAEIVKKDEPVIKEATKKIKIQNEKSNIKEKREKINKINTEKDGGKKEKIEKKRKTTKDSVNKKADKDKKLHKSKKTDTDVELNNLSDSDEKKVKDSTKKSVKATKKKEKNGVTNVELNPKSQVTKHKKNVDTEREETKVKRTKKPKKEVEKND